LFFRSDIKKFERISRQASGGSTPAPECHFVADGVSVGLPVGTFHAKVGGDFVGMTFLGTARRFRLPEGDREFLAATLGRTAGDADGVLRLLVDPETVDGLLDRPEVLERILRERGTLAVSEFLYFYLLVRRVFRDHGLEDPDLSDYVAGTLADFSADFRPPPGARSPLPFVVDLAEELEAASGHYDRFFVSVKVGNLLVVATGIFHEHLRRRSQRRGAPGLRYYEEFGAGVFREAGQHPLAREFLLEEKFLRLGSSFSSSRRALNRLSEQFLLWN
jgi:hypothetical protein